MTAVGFFSSDFGFAGHSHEQEHEFHYLPQARCTLLNKGRRVYLPDHSLIYSEPRTAHGIVSVDSTRPPRWYFFRFAVQKHNEDIVSVLRKAFEPRGYIRLGPPFDDRFREIMVRSQSDDRLLRASGSHLFASFVYEIAWNGWQQSLIRASKHVDDLVRWMQENLSSALNLNAAAREMGIDKSYLIRLFKKKAGASPVKFFNRLKVDTASYLLSRTDTSAACSSNTPACRLRRFGREVGDSSPLCVNRERMTHGEGQHPRRLRLHARARGSQLGHRDRGKTAG
jgi:AraC-like DNA-binding protein